MSVADQEHAVRRLLGLLSKEVELLAGMVDDVQDAVGSVMSASSACIHADPDAIMKLQSLDRISQTLWDMKLLVDTLDEHDPRLPEVGTDWIDKAVALFVLRARHLIPSADQDNDECRTEFF